MEIKMISVKIPVLKRYKQDVTKLTKSRLPEVSKIRPSRRISNMRYVSISQSSLNFQTPDIPVSQTAQCDAP